MGGDGSGGHVKTSEPVGQHQSQAVVLTGRVARVVQIQIFTIDRGLQADVQCEIVDTPLHRTVGHSPFTQERGKPSPIGPLQRIHKINHLAVQTDQGVIADLVLVPGMGCLECVDGRSHAVHRLVKNNDPW